VSRTVDFASVLGLTGPAQVRDLWAHEDVGTLTSWTASLGPHGSSLVKVTPMEAIRHQADVGGLSGGARFENTFSGHTGMGYVTGLDTAGSSLTLAIAVSQADSTTACSGWPTERESRQPHRDAQDPNPGRLAASAAWNWRQHGTGRTGTTCGFRSRSPKARTSSPRASEQATSVA